MSRKIWKMALEHAPRQVIDTPSEWRPLSFGNQEGTPTLWFEAHPGTPLTARMVFLAFTGEEVPPGRYVGTAVFGMTGMLVVHCYVK